MRRAGLLIFALLALELCLSTGSFGAAGAPAESYQKLLSQIDAGSVVTALVNRVGHDVKVTLRDSTNARAVYPSHQEHQLVSRLKAQGAQVKYTRRRHVAAHHILRYIGGAIVIVIIAAGGGMFLYTRRRQSSGGRSETQLDPGAPRGGPV